MQEAVRERERAGLSGVRTCSERERKMQRVQVQNGAGVSRESMCRNPGPPTKPSRQEKNPTWQTVQQSPGAGMQYRTVQAEILPKENSRKLQRGTQVQAGRCQWHQRKSMQKPRNKMQEQNRCIPHSRKRKPKTPEPRHSRERWCRNVVRVFQRQETAETSGGSSKRFQWQQVQRAGRQETQCRKI